MFCMKCGKQLPEDARFCSACGAETDRTVRKTAAERPAAAQTAAAAQPVRPAAAAPKPAAAAQNHTQKAKKNTNPLPLIIFFACIYLAAFWLLRQGEGSKAPVIDNIPFSSASGQTFEQILPQSYLASERKVNTPGYAAYVMEDAEGIIYLMEYGYEKDLVKEVVSSVLIPTSGWSSADIGNYLIEVNEMIDAMHDQHSFVTGSASVVGAYEYVVVEVHMTDMDLELNLRIAVEEELIIVDGEIQTLSMYLTEQNMRSEGYAKK